MDLISDEMSRRIIAAAEQIARTSGAESVTVRSILRALGISNRVFQQVLDIVENTLVMSYECKRQFSQYVFESDSVSHDNYAWWTEEIKRLIEFGKARGYLRDVDSDIMSYSIWCFIRGFNADALGRKLPVAQATAAFKYSFGILLDGLRPVPDAP